MRDALGRIDHVAVFGGTSEIGTHIARTLVAGHGAGRVTLVGRDEPRLETAADRLRGRAGHAGGPAVAVRAGFDAADTEAHGPVVDEVFADGDVDVTVLAFGVLGDQARAEADPDAALEVARVNYLGAVSVGLRVADHIERQGRGDLVVLSSVAGDRGRRDNYVYGSSKAGLDTFAAGLGDRLVATGGHVLVARPGFVHTRMTADREPAPLATTPDAVAADVAAALDRRAEVVYSPRVLAVVMFVLRLLPRPLFRLVAGR